MEELLAKIPSQRADTSSPKEADTPAKPASAPAKSIITEKPTTPTDKEPAQAKVVETKPLSPYTVYEDLKPPSSPSPRQSGHREVSSSASTPVENISTSTGGNSAPIAVATGISEKDSSQQSTCHSPYYIYDDLKPPSSPTPSAPTTTPVDSGSQGAALLVNSTAQSLIANKPSDEQHNAKTKPRPLSPFTIYEDLKPPTSTIPSPRKS